MAAPKDAQKKKQKKPQEKRRFSITITSADADTLKTESCNLFVPTLLELKQLLLSKNDGLSNYFKNVLVEVIEPSKVNLQKIFGLSSKGISGSEIIVDIGSLDYLHDKNLDKDTLPGYSITDITSCINKKHFNKDKDVYIFGSAFGSTNVVKNSEIIIDWNSKINHKNIKSIEYEKKISEKLITKDDEKKDSSSSVSLAEIQQDTFKIAHYPSNEIGCQGNLFLSEGLESRLLLIECEVRTGDLSFVEAIESVLSKYKKKDAEDGKDDTVIGLGGLIQVLNGELKGHLMTNYNDKKKVSSKAGKDLKMFSTIVSKYKKYEINNVHCHFLNGETNEGGHYDNDVTPKTVKYRGYFNVAKYLYVVGNPKQK